MWIVNTSGQINIYLLCAIGNYLRYYDYKSVSMDTYLFVRGIFSQRFQKWIECYKY